MEWYRDTDFWLTFSSVLFDNQRWVNAPLEAQRAAELLQMKPGDRLLDACCGVGRHSVEFAARGLRVTGVDQMGLYLEAAEETAEAEGVEVEFVKDDMLAFRREEWFDGAVNMFISVGYFDDPEDDIKVFRNIRDSLKPGGGFLVDTVGKEILMEQFRSKEWYRTDGNFVISRYRAEENYGRLWNRWILYDQAGRHEYTFSHRVFSADELTEALKKAGFSSVTVFGDLDGSPYGPQAQRLVAVGLR
ncbi:MAG: class I SAM-dependent methyltransferase [Spirochaetales bacterium]|nr:class I SAM-dependent methyltransferase [Spirochaetales bacterium]